MQETLTGLVQALGSLGGGMLSLVPTVMVVLLLVVVQRALSRQAQRTTGLRFRNQLIMAAVSFVGVLVIVVVLPIDAGLRGQLLTLIGIIISVTISLSSSTFLGNAMAGIMLKSVRNFRSGDFVQVGEFMGRVTERGLFHTEIQTPTRDLTTLPNLYLATTPVTVVRSSGTIVDATVSLGYDVPHGRIENLLMEAAAACELKEPFVQVLELGDFSVTYRVAGLLEDPKLLLTLRSRLRAAVLDSLHGGGVEIVSPGFMNVRDYAGDRRFVPRGGAAPRQGGADASVDVVFDKAEEAESLEKLKSRLADAEKAAPALQEQLKQAEQEPDKERLQHEIARNERLTARLRELVTAAEAREKKT